MLREAEDGFSNSVYVYAEASSLRSCSVDSPSCTLQMLYKLIFLVVSVLHVEREVEFRIIDIHPKI